MDEHRLGESWRRWRRRTATAIMVATLTLGVAACSNEANTDAKSGGEATTAASSSAPAGELAGATGGQLLRVGETKIPSVGKKRVGIVTVCAQCSGMARFLKSFRAEAKKQGWTVTVTDTGGDAGKIVAGMNTFVQSKVDFLILAAVDPSGLSAQIKAAHDAGIPVAVNEGDWVPNTVFACCQDSVGMGTEQAQWVAQRLNGEGEIVMFTLPAARTVNQRATTFKAAIGLQKGIKIVAEEQIDIADPIGSTKAKMASLLLKHPNVKAVWAGFDDPARGAAQAIAESGAAKGAFVIGNDAGPDALSDIRGDSPLDGTVFVDYTTVGKIFVAELAQYFAEKTVTGRSIYVQQPIISRHLGNVPPAGQEPPAVGYYSVWPSSAAKDEG